MLASSAFDLLARLGAGTSSTVYACRHDDSNAVVKLGRPGAAHTLANEARCLTLADSRYLPRLLQAGTLTATVSDDQGSTFAAGTPYLLLSRLRGESLSTQAFEHSNEAATKVAEVVLRDVSGALRDLHASGFAHGDVKPDNTLIDPDALRAFSIDLGLACPLDSHNIQGATPAYLPPETFGDGSAAQSRDLWALGRTVLTLLDPAVLKLSAAQLLNSSSRKALLKLPKKLQRLVTSLLSENPAHRPRANWIHSQLCDKSEGTDSQSQVRRVYIGLRQSELSPLLRGARYKLNCTGLPARWLEATCSRFVQIREMNGVPPNDNIVSLGTLSLLDKRRWLLRLTGVYRHNETTLIRNSESDIADALSDSCAHGAPSLIALAGKEQFEKEESLSPDQQVLELGGGCPNENTLHALESRHLESHLPPDVALELARVLLRRNEIARSRVILSTLSSEKSVLEYAYLLTRAGSRFAAEESLTRCTESQDAEVASEASALLARLCLDQGNKSQAEEWLQRAGLTPRALESRIALQLTNAELEHADETLAVALSLHLGPAQRARFRGLQANLAAQRSELELALSYYRSATEHAERAGAILDEATYLTGIAQAASSLGHISDAIDAAQRAILLFEYLDRPDSTARVELVLASTLGLAGAKAEARSSAERCFRQARRTGDNRCAFYAQLVLADNSERKDLADHLKRAANQLTRIEVPTAGDRLHLAARQWNTQPTLSCQQFDTLASQESPAIGARLTWWTARAARHVETSLRRTPSQLASFPPAHEGTADQMLVLTQLAACAARKSALEAKAPALALGAQLAALLGNGGQARRLTEQARGCFATLAAHTPPSLKPSLSGLVWTERLLTSEQSPFTTEQVSDVVSLIGSLGERERLTPLLERVLDAMILWTGVERGLLLLRAPEGKLVPRAARNIARRNLSEQQRELSTTLANRAVETRECVVAVDAAGELPDFHQSVHALKLRSVLAVPLIAHGEVIGVVYLDDRVRRGAFGPQELAWVQLAATIASVAIADTKAQLMLRRSLRQTKRAEARAAQALAARNAELAHAQQKLDASDTANAFPEIIGSSGALEPLFRSLHRIAAAEVPVLILGESGTGKELVAHAIHRHSPRRDGKFVIENCSAIPETLMESALFGHVRGAFTGASHDRLGLFELANGGTLFLDEIADMPAALQVKLLRVLEDGMVRPVGSERVKKVDVRVLTATHKDLSQLASQGQFRSDLLYRLNVFELRLPPLRERREDIPALIQHFIKKHTLNAPPPTLSAAATEQLVAAQWPGNVRQLENEIRRALVLCDSSIRREHLSAAAGRTDEQRHQQSGAALDRLHLKSQVNKLERELIEQALAETNGNQTKAARELGISRYGLQKKMRRLFPTNLD